MTKLSWHEALTVAMALALFASAPATAQPPPAKAPTARTSMTKARNACRLDIQKLCKDVEAGKGRIYACLLQHAAHVSPPCQEELKNIRERAAQRPTAGDWAGPCKSDIQTQCKDLPPSGNVKTCLEQRMTALSDGCKAALQVKK